MGDPGGALRISGVSPGSPIWARTVDGSRVLGWDHREALGDQPNRGSRYVLTWFSTLPGRARRHAAWDVYQTPYMHGLAVLRDVSLVADRL